MGRVLEGQVSLKSVRRQKGSSGFTEIRPSNKYRPTQREKIRPKKAPYPIGLHSDKHRYWCIIPVTIINRRVVDFKKPLSNNASLDIRTAAVYSLIRSYGFTARLQTPPVVN